MFTKLFSSITTSSIWNEDNNTRILWITMLAMSNRDGYVSASIGGLAHEARLTKEDCEKALKVLSSPDQDSRSKEFDGRRIDVVDGGFQLLNHAKYRAMRSEEERKEYMKSYMAEYRRTKNVNKNVNNVSVCKPALTGVNRSKPPLAQAEADTEAEAEENKKEEAVASLPSLSNEEKMEKTVKAGEMALKAQRTSSKKNTSKSQNLPIGNAWCREYEKFKGHAYVWTYGDDKAVSILETAKISIEEMVTVIRSTWNNKESFWFDKINTISFFAKKYNDLRADSESYRKMSSSTKPTGCFQDDL